MIAFIREHKDQRVPGPDGVAGLRWGVEPMCTVLSEHGTSIAPATYYEWVDKPPTAQQLRDEQVTGLIRAEREDLKTGKFASTLGSRKMWLRLRGKGHNVARCTIERLMRASARPLLRDTRRVSRDSHAAVYDVSSYACQGSRRRGSRTYWCGSPAEPGGGGQRRTICTCSRCNSRSPRHSASDRSNPLETAMAGDVAAFYADGQAPLSSATPAAYGDSSGSSQSQGARDSGHQPNQPSQPQMANGQSEPVPGGSDIGVPSERATSGPEGSAQTGPLGSGTPSAWCAGSSRCGARWHPPRRAGPRRDEQATARRAAPGRGCRLADTTASRHPTALTRQAAAWSCCV